MFCPKCRVEYRKGFTECSDCGSLLVDELPPEDEVEWVDLVTVLTTVNSSTVALAKSILEQADIRYVATGQLPREMLAIGAVQIQVSRNDEDEALELLEHLEDLDADILGDEEEDEE